MSLRKTLEELWSDPLVRCPLHRVWWTANEYPDNAEKKPRHIQRVQEDLFYAPGKRVNPEPKPPRVE